MANSFLDNVTEAINGGVAYADKKTQIMRCHNELSTLAKQKTQALSEFGMSVLNRESGNPQFLDAYAEQVSAIRSIEQRENELRMQIDALRQDTALNTGGQFQGQKQCAHCGAVCPDRAAFCVNCGTPLTQQQQVPVNPAPAQAGGMICRTCSVQYPADYVWCERCRSRLERVPDSVPAVS